MGELSDPCEYCGGERVAFVRYERNATDAQTQTDWIAGTPERLYSVVCQDCGMGKAALDPREADDLPEFDDLPDGTGSTSDFRVEDTLE